ncbi:uncharacterized protein LOC106460597 isoform X1 [Limulus polyphemus]|uniref:Uncharacterized protein LOC106460597 isoform X1 n=1 Tax=Limulus polyphemus TaxID=6850 RepID=A0ABM1SHE6_LIMPO|nr:uncharacterized protein LOC106460597 isoform X1 [Limulus polyphemus]XP_022243050.1 uncharacterized protein LOC106460597 isoform X1 [Limulus polyphemus]XP_022243051.1 uncharacterized protein LOC106460597 isoform X1 [Limulus polyphemus]
MVDSLWHQSPSRTLVLGCILTFIAAVLLIIAFACPYWMESDSETDRRFVRMGLWSVCFNNYKHLPYSYDRKFDGCHWIYGYEYEDIRDWLQPGWFVFVQTMMSFALWFSMMALFTVFAIVMRVLMKLEVFLLASSAVLCVLTALPLFLAVAVFGGLCYDRSWLPGTSFNYISWAYALGVISIFFHILSSACLFSEAGKARERRRMGSNLVYNIPSRGIVMTNNSPPSRRTN